MVDPAFYVTLATAALVGLAMLVFAGLTGFRGWLDLKRQQLARDGGGADGLGHPGVGARIELADLKERIRRLEAIAAGVDL